MESKQDNEVSGRKSSRQMVAVIVYGEGETAERNDSGFNHLKKSSCRRRGQNCSVVSEVSSGFK